MTRPAYNMAGNVPQAKATMWRQMLAKLGLPWAKPHDPEPSCVPPAVAEPKRSLQQLIARTPVLRIALGAGPIEQPGWISTDRETLDITRREDWQLLFSTRRIDFLVAEHVWEHLAEPEAQRTNQNCFTFLKPGGQLRLAVPDGFHPDPHYRQAVQPNGTGAGADDHKVLYNYRLLTGQLHASGFQTELLEYWDETGRFHYAEWSSEHGHIRRSRRFDLRNQDGSLTYTSLIVDAFKP